MPSAPSRRGWRSSPLRVRIGIHTGPVVVGQTGPAQRREIAALGHTLNLAARLQGVATPDSVVISAETLRLVQGLFVTEPLGEFALKGIAQPVMAHRVLRPSGVRSRLDVAAASGLTPLVGREDELAALLERWDRAGQGGGEVVLVCGDAGIGKSRLVRAFAERLVEERHTWLECRGSPYHSNTAFHPVIELMRQGLRFAGDSHDQQVAWVERAVELAGVQREAVVPLLAGLLSLPLPDRYPAVEVAPEVQRRRTLEALVGWLCALATLQPVVLVVEDLHWTDPSTLALLDALVERVQGAPILLVATHRPVFDASRLQGAHVTRLILQPLTRRQTLAMVRAVAGATALSPATLEHVARKTDGVPLFVEELTKSVLESGGGGSQAIPATLQDSLNARLDRLGPAKEVAQLGAVLGREFSHDLIAAAWRADGESLETGLGRLEAAGLVFRRGAVPDLSYTFKHALVQDAAYQSLLKETRRLWHAHIAGLLPERFPRLVAAEPEQAARHCEAGGLHERAVEYYRQAAERATERSAYAEAIGHLTRGLDLLADLPEDPARVEREVVLQVALGASIAAARGWGTHEAKRAYERARTLCERLGEPPQLFQVIRGLVAFCTSNADFDGALELSTRLLQIAERSGDSSQLLLANHHLGITRYYRGEPALSAAHFERALARYDPVRHRSLSAVYQTEPGVDVRIWMAWPLWMLGFQDRALALSREGVALSREAAHPFSLGYALVWTAVVHLWRREPVPARAASDEAIAIATEHDVSFVRAGGRITRAVSRLTPGASESEVAAAMDDFQHALSDFGAMGVEVGRPHILGQVAAGLAAVGRLDGARAALEGARECSARTSQVYWDAELHRLTGEVLAVDPTARGEAEAHLRTALAIARRQGAAMLALRAAVSLARFLRERGGEAEVLGLLTAAYGALSEGLDTADLRDARALIEALS
jgi:predicted ATPase